MIESDFTYSEERLKTITATHLARNLRRVLDRLAIDGEGIVIERNRQQIARILPGPAQQTALEAMADLYRTLPDDAAAGWEADSRKGRWKGGRLDNGIRNPWPS
jgi:antitoxin (DNA-binding transcriptional repressor) of toxin-antitoxin stability system